MKEYKYKIGDRVVLSYRQITAFGIHFAGSKGSIVRRLSERQSGFIYTIELIDYSTKINVLEHEIDLDREYYHELKLNILGI